ncbi:hypothetical protein BUALT_Bualt04G0091100 [Buddleja alternifolia]|uniref:Bet v I/Major latex protein domain-containing protein n=1 Tax=Buddleja alternifolia TaxID=168488 RepID=A0AAV6XPI6_9LAMI|nr:hypothetical protein BUALT_Bualt04G0091100 [Buddleja alternifolia]
MANLVDILDATAAIKCPADKFYNFFKYNMSDLVKIFPASFKGAQLLEGQEGTVGCVILWNYLLGVLPMSAKVITEAIDDAGKSITFAVLEGDVLQLYKSFKATLTVSDGLAKWSFAYEKATLLSPPPELYLPFGIAICTMVDAYLLINN